MASKKKTKTKPKTTRTPREDSKIQKLRRFLETKKSATLAACAKASGYTEADVLVARHVLANPDRTEKPLITKYDRGTRKLTIGK